MPRLIGGDGKIRTYDSYRMKVVHYHFATSPINTFVRSYSNLTPSGLYFHLSLSDAGVCCIIVHDIFDGDCHVAYFRDVNLALRFINNF